jgi:hypothetical protein
MSRGPGLLCSGIGSTSIAESTCCSFWKSVEEGNWKRYKIGDSVVVARRFRLDYLCNFQIIIEQRFSVTAQVSWKRAKNRTIRCVGEGKFRPSLSILLARSLPLARQRCGSFLCRAHHATQPQDKLRSKGQRRGVGTRRQVTLQQGHHRCDRRIHGHVVAFRGPQLQRDLLARRVGDLTPEQAFVIRPLSFGWPRHRAGDDPLEQSLHRSSPDQAAQPIQLLDLLDRLAASGIDLDGGNARRIVGGRHIAPGDTERRYDLVPKGDLRQPGSDLDNVTHGPVWWRRGVVDSTGVWLSCTWIVVANAKLSVVVNFLSQSSSALLAFAITLK